MGWLAAGPLRDGYAGRAALGRLSWLLLLLRMPSALCRPHGQRCLLILECCMCIRVLPGFGDEHQFACTAALPALKQRMLPLVIPDLLGRTQAWWL